MCARSRVPSITGTSLLPTLTAGTECVALQLNRFATEGRVVSKVTVAVSLPLQFSLPVWVEGAVQHLVFKLSAALIHLGDTPKQGHYRALLVEQTGRMWWTDDGRSALPPASTDAKGILCNSYVLFYRPSQEAE